jgi:CHAD domain-containing protein
MEKADKKLIQIYSANLLGEQILFLENQIEGLLYEEDIEFVHHTRVISRRIRNTILVFQNFLGKKNTKKWFSETRMLTRNLTTVRDLDIQIEFLESELSKIENKNLQPGIQRLLLRKKQKRELCKKLISSTVQEFSKSKTISDIKNFVEESKNENEVDTHTIALKKIAYQVIDQRLSECFSFVPFITDPKNIQQLHQLRISMKNLRYTTELFTNLYPQLQNFIAEFKKFQDELGLIHDYDVWMGELDKFLIKEERRIVKFYGQNGPFNFLKPGILYLKNQFSEKRNSTYNIFIEHWNVIFQNAFWSEFSSQFIVSETEN